MRTSFLLSCIVVFLALPANLVLAGNKAEDYQRQFDPTQGRPAVGTSLARLLSGIGCNEESKWNGPNNPPFGAPAGATSIFLQKVCSRDAWNVDCLTICAVYEYSASVLIYFDDGSRYIYRYQYQDLVCSDGNTTERSESSDYMTAASIGTGTNNRTVFRNAFERTQTQQSSVAGEVIEFSEEAHAGVRIPAGDIWLADQVLADIVLNADDVELRTGPGGTLDLRGFSLTNPLLVQDQPVNIFADEILLDPGVNLEDLFGVVPNVLPGENISDLRLQLHRVPCQVGPGSDEIVFSIISIGNDTETVNVGFSDTQGWGEAGNVDVDIAQGDRALIPVSLNIPEDDDVCVLTDVELTALASDGTSTTLDHTVYVDGDFDSDGVENTCDGCPDQFDPTQSDSDGDGYGDGCDNCPVTFNPGQNDTDDDGFGDACEGGAAPAAGSWGLFVMLLLMVVIVTVTSRTNSIVRPSDG